MCLQRFYGAQKTKIFLVTFDSASLYKTTWLWTSNRKSSLFLSCCQERNDWCQTINYNLLACYRWKQNWKITFATDFMAFLVKALFWWNECSKNADISILSNFMAIFQNFFSISRNFTKYHLHAKFQISWTIQTEITEGQNLPPPPPPGHTNLQKARPV